MNTHVPVAIIGAGPAGLQAAAVLAPRVDGPVVVFDREAQAGGVPRHCNHPGYGMRDMRRVMTGPAYARSLVKLADRAGATIKTSSMVTDWADDHSFNVTSPKGRDTVTADAIVIATGARERPRAARWVPGDRPAGVFTTGELQQAIHLEHQKVGSQAVVVGSELVSWSAVLTLRMGGVNTVAMVTESPRPETYAMFTYPGSLVFGTPLHRSTRVVRVIGRHRVSGVEVEQLSTGRRAVIPCDTVVFTGDWIPDHELVRRAGIEIDPATLGPRVDAGLTTAREGVFAAGNVIHPVDTAGVAAMDGVHVADSVFDYLSHASAPGSAVKIVAEAPIKWVTPSAFRAGGRKPPAGRLLFWADRYVPRPTLVARQDERVIGTVRLGQAAAPGRVFHAPWQLVAGARPDAGDIQITLG
ncbi:MAG: FAD-dependent oxidoreductase [Propionibacteriaceae bacterium]|nr:FAD-dependent oxidoreductase [Propionibacteriaceae bacterium]